MICHQEKNLHKFRPFQGFFGGFDHRVLALSLVRKKIQYDIGDAFLIVHIYISQGEMGGKIYDTGGPQIMQKMVKSAL